MKTTINQNSITSQKKSGNFRRSHLFIQTSDKIFPNQSEIMHGIVGTPIHKKNDQKVSNRYKTEQKKTNSQRMTLTQLHQILNSNLFNRKQTIHCGLREVNLIKKNSIHPSSTKNKTAYLSKNQQLKDVLFSGLKKRHKKRNQTSMNNNLEKFEQKYEGRYGKNVERFSHMLKQRGKQERRVKTSFNF